MITKIKNIPLSEYIKFFSDIRNIGMVIFGIIVILVTWSGVKVVQTNYDLQKQISVMQQENDVEKIENSNIALRNKYYETDQYLELVARKQYNKALPGETLVIVPKSVAVSNSVEPLDPNTIRTINADEDISKIENNFNSWLEFLFRD